MSNYDAWLLSGPGGPEDDGPPECLHCDGPCLTADERQSGECDVCWHARQQAMNDLHASEMDAAYAHLEAQRNEPEPVCCGEDELPF